MTERFYLESGCKNFWGFRLSYMNGGKPFVTWKLFCYRRVFTHYFWMCTGVILQFNSDMTHRESSSLNIVEILSASLWDLSGFTILFVTQKIQLLSEGWLNLIKFTRQNWVNFNTEFGLPFSNYRNKNIGKPFEIGFQRFADC